MENSTLNELNKQYLEIIMENDLESLVEFFIVIPNEYSELQETVLTEIKRLHTDSLFGESISNHSYNLIFEFMFVNKSTKFMIDYYVDQVNAGKCGEDVFELIIKNRKVCIEWLPENILKNLNISELLLLHYETELGEDILNQLLTFKFSTLEKVTIHLLFKNAPDDYIARINKYYKYTPKGFKFDIGHTSSNIYYYNYKLKRMSDNIDDEMLDIYDLLLKIHMDGKMGEIYKNFYKDLKEMPNGEFIDKYKGEFFHTEKSLYDYCKDYPESANIIEGINIYKLDVDSLFMFSRYSSINHDNYPNTVNSMFDLASMSYRTYISVFNNKHSVDDYTYYINREMNNKLRNEYDKTLEEALLNKLQLTIFRDTYLFKDEFTKMITSNKLPVDFLIKTFEYIPIKEFFKMIETGYTKDEIIKMIVSISRLDGFEIGINRLNWNRILEGFLETDDLTIPMEIVEILYKSDLISFPSNIIFSGCKIKTAEVGFLPDDFLRKLDFYTLAKL